MSVEVQKQPLEQPPSGEEQPTVYSWLTSNPLATSTGAAISSIYSASKNYNRVTQTTIGSLESVVTYAADTAKPMVGAVAGKLEKPITAVDGAVANGLVSLEKRYPIIGKEPSEIAEESKEAIKSTITSSHEAIGNTRAGQVIGRGVGYTLTAAESVIDMVLPPEEKKVEEEEDDEEEEKSEEEVSPSATPKKRSWFGLRKRKSKTKEVEMKEVIEPEVSIVEDAGDKVPPSNVERLVKLTSAVYYRSLANLKTLQEQCYEALRRLKTSLKVLRYAQNISLGLHEQSWSKFLRLRIKTKEETDKDDDTNEEFASWLTEDQDNEDIQWLLKAGEKKGKTDIFQLSLDYAKGASERIYKMFQSFSGITAYLPPRLRDGANSGLQQAKDIYTTLKLNNVPAELPSFLLSQITEIVETQILYCKKLGTYLSAALKKRFCTVDEIDISSTGGDSEVQMDEVEDSSDDEASSHD